MDFPQSASETFSLPPAAAGPVPAGGHLDHDYASGAVPMPGPPADLGARFVARLIDAGLYCVLLVGVGLFLQLLPNLGRVGEGLSGALAVTVFLAYPAYELVLIALLGQTLGKRIMKLRVVRLGGQLPGWGSSAIRYFVPAAASAFTCGVGGALFYLSVLFDSSPWKRGWYDQMASTVVIHATR